MVFKVLPVSLVIGVSCAAFGCGGDDVKYVPKPAHSGTKANLPSVPSLAKKPIKQGEDYTIWGLPITSAASSTGKRSPEKT